MSYSQEEGVINEQDQKSIEREKSDKIKVSSNRSVFYYVDLAAESLAVFPEVELSGLGFAITTAVTIAEILRSQEIAAIAKVNTTLVGVDGRRGQKPKIQILLTRSKNFDQTFAKKKQLSEESKIIRKELEENQKRVQDGIKKATA
eukprot:TRINITY_DN9407_c0_g1_i1.p1 TRINITY_DN9407_c0_g1~~TRINITY_DN9407_c0_g1_i1.p1  ORF type:complete len:155 (+),score=42.68 TRINITY_DN9407_c0_g1_i1:28-465(+)